MLQKNIIFLVLLITIFSYAELLSQKQFVFKYDSIRKSEMMIGILDTNILKKDTQVVWIDLKLKSNISNNLLKATLDSSIYFLVFLGTWCQDSRNIIPEFIQYLSLKSFHWNNSLFIGVDRKKKDLHNFYKMFNITNVPTIIALKKGKEIFRIIEYGKKDDWQKSLLQYMNKFN